MWAWPHRASRVALRQESKRQGRAGRCSRPRRQGEMPMMKRRDFLRVSAGGLVAAPFVSTSAFAADYPDKPVHWIVGYAPGGTTDILARLIGAISVGEDRPAVHHREQGRRRQQSRRSKRCLHAPPTATPCCWSIRRTASTPRSTRSCRSISSATSRRSPASSACRT